jgi:hypothetical protein
MILICLILYYIKLLKSGKRGKREVLDPTMHRETVKCDVVVQTAGATTPSESLAKAMLPVEKDESELLFDMWNGTVPDRYLPRIGHWEKNILLSSHEFPFQPSDVVHLNTSSSLLLKWFDDPTKNSYVVRYIEKDEAGRPSGTKKLYIRFNSHQSDSCIAHMERHGCIYIDRPFGYDVCLNLEARNLGYNGHGGCSCRDCKGSWTLQTP